MKSNIALCSIALIAGLGSGLVQARTWTSTDGKTIEAEFIRATADSVFVRIVSGPREVAIPLSRLSEADQKWVSDQKPAPAAAGPVDAERVSTILEATFKSEPNDEDRKLVEDFITGLLPNKGANDEEIRWEVSFLPWGGNGERDSVLISADMFPKEGGDDGRLMWFHIAFSEEEQEVFTQEKFGRYPAMRMENRHCFVTVNRVDVRAS
ncbi:MAG: hypothetical protein AAF585_26810 [Verrucomicrobiota bacterium]